jgi:hypothetical protein
MAKAIDSISKVKKDTPDANPAEVPPTEAPAPVAPQPAPVTPAAEPGKEEGKPAETPVASPTEAPKEEVASEAANQEAPKEETPTEEPKEATPPTDGEKKEESTETVVPTGELPPLAPATPADGEAPTELSEGDSYESLFPEPTVVISSPPTWIWWTLLIIGSLGLAFLGYNLANGKINQWLSINPTPTPSSTTTSTATATPSATATATATPAPTATPSATTSVTKSSITIRVLNGTTTAGAAGTAKTILQNAGFTVRTVGNAQKQTYTSTIIYYQTGHQADAAAVKAALPKYTSSLEESSSLASPDNVLVVLGPAS